MHLYKVVRTTTDKLEAELNDRTANRDLAVSRVEWVGGRDWVLVFTVALADDTPATAVNESTTTTSYDDYGRIVAQTTVSGRRDDGWVADQARRHARFDALRQLNGDDLYDDELSSPAPFAHLVDPEVEHGDLRYGRYDEHRVPTHNRFAGWVEDHARSWIIFLGEHGAPALYWPRRDRDGGVIGAPVEL